MMRGYPDLPHGFRWHVTEDYPRSITVYLLRCEMPQPVVVGQWSITRQEWSGDWDRTKIARESAEALVQYLNPKAGLIDAAYLEGYTDGYDDGDHKRPPTVKGSFPKAPAGG